jgi:hypothetical protein
LFNDIAKLFALLHAGQLTDFIYRTFDDKKLIYFKLTVEIRDNELRL